MADVTTSFAAKDESFAQTVDRLNARLAGFQQTVADFSGKVGNMASAFGGFATKIGTVAAAFLGAQSAVQTFKQAIDVGGQLAELSARTGETAGNLAVLQRAFQNAGSSGEAVGPMLNRLQKFMVEASTGGKQQIETMTGLGLSYDDLAGKTPTEQMATLARSISSISDPAERATAAIAVFGKSGGELLPLLQNMDSDLASARGQLGSYPDAVDQAAASLDGIGDAFAAVTTKAQEFVTGALVKIAPEIENVLNAVAQIDFAAFGMRLSESLEKAVNFFRGLWSNPSQIFGLLGDYLNATFRQAGDSLVSAFLTAGNALTNFFSELVNGGVFTQLGQVLADALVFGASKLGVLLIDGIEAAMNLFGTLWASVTSQGVSGFAAKLLDVAKFFASDFVQAMTNPVAFIAGKIGSSLADAVTQGAETYKFSFDSATGSYIEKARAGFQSVSDTAGANLQQSASTFGETLVTAATNAAAQSDLIEVNLFGGAEAINQVNQRIGEIVTAGEEYRGAMESSVAPATQVKAEAQATASEGRSFAGAINQAKIDAEATANVFTGLSDRMSSAVNSTSTMLDKMREAFHFGRTSAQEAYQKYRDGGMSILEASKAAAAHMTQQNTLDANMRSAENKVRLAENAKDRSYERAERMDRAGQEKSAHNLRMRADAKLTKTLEEISPELKKGAQDASRLLGDGGSGAGDDVTAGGSSAEDSMTSGGEAAGESISTAASALKDAVSGMGKALALDATLVRCEGFLKSINEKLPQNALS
jgi:hypothetical protein